MNDFRVYLSALHAFRALLNLRAVIVVFALFISPVWADDGLKPNDLTVNHAVDEVDLLAINDEIKEILDRSISGIRNKKERAKALHVLLFNDSYLGIKYGRYSTQTAQQTFDSAVGNCISLASLYVAAARYVGLKAVFQTVKVPREWFEESSFYIVPTHINVAVTTSRMETTLIVEFTDVYAAKDTRLYKSKVIPDKRVLAEYYNNLGMELMQEKQTAMAIEYLEKSTKTYSKVAFIWSNLGVLYKSAGMDKQAERAYKKGLSLDKKNVSIINNLYVFYRQTNRDKDAGKLAKKVERYSKKNPYYLARLADSEYKLGNLGRAVRLLKKAIKVNAFEPKFHLKLASIYFTEGDYTKSIQEVNLAGRFSSTDADKSRFERKLSYIRAHQ